MRGLIRAAGFALLLAGTAGAAEIASSVDPADLTKRERTPLGLYLTAADAGAALAADPEIVLIDVRTRAEFQYVGHAEPTDANIPSRFYDPNKYNGKSAYGYTDNAGFVADVDALMARLGKDRDAPVFIICRSGGRSARAVALLAKAGYVNVWNITDGFEGGKDKATGHRTVNGWRNADLPWGYTVHPAQAYPGG